MLLSTLIRRFLLGMKTVNQLKAAIESGRRERSASPVRGDDRTPTLKTESKWKVAVEKCLQARKPSDETGQEKKKTPLPELDAVVDGRLQAINAL